MEAAPRATSVTGLLAAWPAASAVARRLRPSRGVRSPTKSRFSICCPFMLHLRFGDVLPSCDSIAALGRGRVKVVNRRGPATTVARSGEASGLESGQDHARRGRLVQRVEVD